MILQRVRQFVAQHALFRDDTPVLAALSGGSDSVALAVILRELAERGEVRLVGVAHFNHQLREQASRDEECAAGVARSLGLPFVADRGDVALRARRERRSLEDAARRSRYEFFERARTQLGADLVALGHTRDDQAETFLLRLLRGAVPRGLAAMYPRHGTIIRPLLDCRRFELRTFLEKRHISYVEDETNADVAVPRNRVRAELIPLLENRFNPAIVDVLAHEAELARELWGWLESAAAGFERTGLTSSDSLSRELDVARLQSAAPPLRRLVIWRAMNEVSGGRPVSFSHVEAALGLLDHDDSPERAGMSIDAPGHQVHRIGPRLVLRGRDRGRGTGRPGRPTRPEPAANLYEYSLSIPGEVQLAEAGCVLAAELAVAAGEGRTGARSGKGPIALVRHDRCQGPLTVRNRRPGDRFRPVGVGGRKKLQDYFVDRKVALAHRDRVPLVVDAADRIVWVAGYGIDEAFRLTDPSQSVLLLRLR
jgi:tRNA(Ile)-lysidine synthase